MWTSFLLLASSASAQDAGPSPVARCADAASGTEVEICLQLAVEHPEHVDGIAAALRAHIARAGSSDQQLLLALLALVSNETAEDAADQLSDLEDPRAVPVLVACAERRKADVSRSCVAALASYPAGLRPLKRWLESEDHGLGLRQAAARALGEVDSEEAADILVDALRRPRLPAPLRREILDTIDAAYPDRRAATEGQVASDGRFWLAAGGAWGMGFSMGAAGYFGQTDLTALGWATGAVGGATAGWLYGRAWPMESADAAYITTGGILGSSSGMLLGAGLGQDADALYLGGLGGMAVGYAVPVATRGSHPGTAADSVEATAMATATSIAAGSALAWAGVNRSERRTPAFDAPMTAAGIGLAGGAIVGHAVAPHVDLSAHDAGMVALGSAWGMGVGLLVPIGDRDRSALPVATTAGGALLAYGLATPLDLHADIQGGAWAGGVFGGVAGAGVGMLVDPSGQAPSTSALGFGTAGMLAGAALAQADPEPLDDRDVVLVGLASSWATWQSAGWAGYLQPAPEQAGWFLIAPAAVGAGMAIATPETDVPVPHAVAATSLGLWGAYGGGVAAELADQDVLLASLIGSNIGLAGGALVMSPVVGTPPVVIGVADAGGVLGGSVGALGAAFATSSGDAILTSSLVGAGLGFAGGAALGASWKKGGTKDMARMPRTIPGRWLVRPDMGPDRMGMAVEVRQW